MNLLSSFSLRHLTFIIAVVYSGLIYAQTTLPTSCDFTGSELPTSGWSANSPQFYSSSGNPAPAFKFNGTEKYLLIHFDHTPGSLSFDVVANGVQSTESLFLVQESTDGEEFTNTLVFDADNLPDITSYTAFSTLLSPATRYVKFFYKKKGYPNGGNIGLDNVFIYPAEVNHQEIEVRIENTPIPNQTTVQTGASLETSTLVPFSILNVGQIDNLIIDEITISGANATEFSLSENISFPLSIEPTTAVEIGILFNPIAEGVRTATFKVISNDLDLPEFILHVDGFGGDYDGETAIQPTNLTFSDIKTYRFKASFTPSNADGYLILRKIGEPISGVPVDGTTYLPGDIIGDAEVVKSSTSTSFTPNDIAANSTYHFAVFAYTNEGNVINYNTNQPLSNSVTTPATMMLPNVYASINTSSSTLVEDLHDIVASHTQHSYGSYISKMINKFYERDTINGQKALTCLYTGETYIYDAPFTFNKINFSREHTFAYSWFPLDNQSGPYYSDYHNLFPLSQNRANGVRSNYPLGIVVSDIITQYGEGVLGRNANGQIVYEPIDEQKGDAARAMLYMCVRYTENNVLWKLPENISYTVPYAQSQSVLKQWNLQDLPSNHEIARNDFIDSLQNNRNPFIDHPEYACYIDFYEMSHLIDGCDDLSIETEELYKSLLIYPNPASHTLTIAVDGARLIAYKLYDTSGKCVKRDDLNKPLATEIDVSSFSKGAYVIEVETTLGKVTKKVLLN